jgi:hypothetical protein
LISSLIYKPYAKFAAATAEPKILEDTAFDIGLYLASSLVFDNSYVESHILLGLSS